MVGGGVSYVVYTYLVRRAPERKDVPNDSVVAEPREEVQNGVVRRQLAALGVALVASVLADAGDEAFDRAPVLVLRRRRRRDHVGNV